MKRNRINWGGSCVGHETRINASGFQEKTDARIDNDTYTGISSGNGSVSQESLDMHRAWATNKLPYDAPRRL